MHPDQNTRVMIVKTSYPVLLEVIETPTIPLTPPFHGHLREAIECREIEGS